MTSERDQLVDVLIVGAGHALAPFRGISRNHAPQADLPCCEGISDPRESFSTNYIPQGVAADVLATLRGYSRSDVDELAVSSQQRAGVAQASGRFDKSVVPALDINGGTLLERDDNLRPDTTATSMGNLSAAFEKTAR